MTINDTDRPGPPRGFGQAVSTYHSFYIGVADAKAGAIAATGGGLLLFAANSALPGGSSAWESVSYWGALAMLFLSVTLAAFAVTPRTPSEGKSLILWSDIRARFDSAAAYADALRALSDHGVEDEFARQNHAVAGVLTRKFGLVSAASWTLLVGFALLAVTTVIGSA